MKNLILAGLFLSVAPTAFAKSVTVTCVSSKEIFEAQFEATGTLEVADDKTVEGQIVYSGINRVNPALADHGTLKVKGKLQIFAAGGMYKQQVDSYQLLSSTPTLASFSLNAGAGDNFSSRLLVERERQYVARCSYAGTTLR